MKNKNHSGNHLYDPFILIKMAMGNFPSALDCTGLIQTQSEISKLLPDNPL